MQERYGSPVICLDLVKAAEKTPREIVLRSEFDTAITYSNTLVRHLPAPHLPLIHVLAEPTLSSSAC